MKSILLINPPFNIAKEKYDTSKIIITSPDVGGVKRTRKLVERLGSKELAIVYKIRDPKTGDIITEEVIGNVEGKKAILIDDQAISLDTLCEGAKIVKSKGAEEVYAYCTHGLMASRKGVTAESKLANSMIEKLYITDTIPRAEQYFEENPKLGLISCVDYFSEALRRIHNNKSLSELFR